MEKYRAVPQGYMTAGEVAKRMGVTVRALQHYDREGLFPPSATSAGGRRLYTDRDLVRLHQILSLKHLGFSLNDIKTRLIPLESPEDVARVLAEQAKLVRQKIAGLSEALSQIEALRAEVLSMRSVNFKKYADIVVNLEMKNDFYWLIKHFDDETLDHIRSRFDRESGLAFLHRFLDLQDEALRLAQEGTAPDSKKGVRFAEAYWSLITEFTGGDASLLPKLMELRQSDGLDREWQQKQSAAEAFISPALEAYFSAQKIDPFEENGKEGMKK